MVRCIGGAKMTMKATISTRLPSNGQVVTGNGEYKRVQDPDSGEILTEWVPAGSPTSINPQAPTYEIPCYARGYTDLGFRSSANHEIILKGEYNVFEAIEFTYPGRFKGLTRQSYITEIRDAKSNDILWTEEETGLPTVFQVQGMTPIYDPFGKLREWTGVVIRAEIQ
jgi:hypothetical protein